MFAVVLLAILGGAASFENLLPKFDASHALNAQQLSLEGVRVGHGRVISAMKQAAQTDACRNTVQKYQNDACFQNEDAFTPANICNGCQSKILDVAQACDPATYAELVKFLPVVCLQDESGNYCFDLFTQLGTVPAGTNPTEAQLNLLCTPCLRLLFDKVVSLVPEADAASIVQVGRYLDFACAKTADNSQYCLTYIAATPNCDLNPTPTCWNSALDYTCHSTCHGRFVALALSDPSATQEQKDRVHAYLEFVCTKNVETPARYCLSVWNTVDWSALGTACLGQTCANTNCYNAVNNFFTTTGCCYENGYHASQFDENPTNVQNWNNLNALVSASGCPATPAACPAYNGELFYTDTLTVTAPFSWFKQNADTATAAILEDLSRNLAVADTHITIDSVTKSSDGEISVTFTLKGADDSQTTVIKSTGQNMKANDAFSWTSTNKASSTYQQSEMNAAASAAPSLLALIAAIVALLF